MSHDPDLQQRIRSAFEHRNELDGDAWQRLQPDIEARGTGTRMLRPVT